MYLLLMKQLINRNRFDFDTNVNFHDSTILGWFFFQNKICIFEPISMYQSSFCF